MLLNHDDVLAQLTGAGLIINHLVIGRMQRVRVEGNGDKHGWYAVHEMVLGGSEVVLVGSYGIWRGDDHCIIRLEQPKRQFSDDQKAAIKTRLTEDAKRAKLVLEAERRAAADRALSKWQELQSTGECDYLSQKGIAAHGLRFAGPGTMIDGESEDGRPWALDVTGALCLPLMDTQARVHGLQFILSRQHSGDHIQRTGRDMEFWPAGIARIGHFHLIGFPTWILLIAEGYASAATLHAATGFPVAVAFEANNLLPVAQALHKRYPRARILVCADHRLFGTCLHCETPVKLGSRDEPCPVCGKPHELENGGAIQASAAALAVGGHWTVPAFESDLWQHVVEQEQKVADFNDLYLHEGLPFVRQQIEEIIDAIGWKAPSARPAAEHQAGEKGEGTLRPIESLDELLERYALVYGQGGKVFDFQERELVELSDLRDLCLSRELHRRWAEHPARQIVRIEQVGFDPTEKDAKISCNTWGGWPAKPKEGDCELLLELLAYLCSGEPNSDEIYRWLICWLAYPLQHPGAKMQSAVVMHGPQGTGKSKFFGTICKQIYGEYGLVINQSAVENPRNTWLANRLFVLAEEVIARAELHNVKNALKDLVTGDTVYVDPKFVNAYPERNHVNLVFLSNEGQPIVLEDDDRRHLIVWTPPPMPQAFYTSLQAEIDAGGGLALYHHLMTADLSGFGPHTRPPMTQAKAHLIDVSLETTSRFFRHLTDGQIPGVVARPALSQDVFTLYRLWCNRLGLKPTSLPRLINALEKKHQVDIVRKRYRFDPDQVDHGPHGLCFFEGENASSGGDEKTWLGQQVTLFRNAIEDYKEGLV